MKHETQPNTAHLVFSGGALAIKCRAPGCKEQAKRWIGWNAAPPGKPPELVKAPLCAEHKRAVKARGLKFIVLGRVFRG
jgi:hypothetical protein